jgi:hypothetical protein
MQREGGRLKGKESGNKRTEDRRHFFYDISALPLYLITSYMELFNPFYI